MGVTRLIVITLMILLLLAACSAPVEEPEPMDTLEVEIMAEMDIEEIFDISIEGLDDLYQIAGGSFNSFFLWENQDQLLLTDNFTGRTLLVKLEELTWQTLDLPFEEIYATGGRIAAIENPSEGKYIIFDDKEGFILFHYGNGNLNRIADIAGDDQPVYKISKDGSRIVYIDRETENITIYSLNTKKKTSFSLDINIGEYLEDFHEKVILSPKGTYLTLMMKDDKGVEGFKSFISDSGNLLHDFVYGLYPSWSNNQQTIAYLFRSSTDVLEKVTINGRSLYTSDKLGLLNRSNKKISLITEVEEPNRIVGHPQWSSLDDTVIFAVGELEISSMYLYNIKNKNITAYYNDGGINSYETMGSDKSLVFHIANEDKSAFKIVNIEEGSSFVIDNMNTFRSEAPLSSKEVPFLIVGDRIYYIKENSIYLLENQNSKCIYKNKREISNIQYLSNIEAISVYFEDGPTTEIIIIPNDL